MNILFVCTGNVSRSFLAEILMRREVEALHLENLSVASAGVQAYPGSPADPAILDYLEERGISVPNHEARQMTQNDADWADLILVMENLHVQWIQTQWPGSGEKVHLLLEYTAVSPGADEVIDPFGRTTYHYRLAEAQIDRAVKSLAAGLAPSGKKERHA